MRLWLAVEDEADIHDVILGMFEVWGIAGLSFVDGADALAWLDEVDKGNVQGDLPELALLDIRLPNVSGLEISRRLRQSLRLCHIGIVLMTAYHLTPKQEHEAIAQAQADVLLYKPLPAVPELRQILAHVVASHQTA